MISKTALFHLYAKVTCSTQRSIGQGCVSPVVDVGLPVLRSDHTLAERML